MSCLKGSIAADSDDSQLHGRTLFRIYFRFIAKATATMLALLHKFGVESFL